MSKTKSVHYLVRRYLVQRDDGFTGNDMWVEFWRGEGLFGLDVMHLERPDWVKRTYKPVIGYQQIQGVTLEEYLEYFQERRRWKVVECDSEAAHAWRLRVLEERQQEEQKLLDEFKDRKRQAMIEIAQERARWNPRIQLKDFTIGMTASGKSIFRS